MYSTLVYQTLLTLILLVYHEYTIHLYTSHLIETHAIIYRLSIINHAADTKFGICFLNCPILLFLI